MPKHIWGKALMLAGLSFLASILSNSAIAIALSLVACVVVFVVWVIGAANDDDGPPDSFAF